jgi:hypothetical protein
MPTADSYHYISNVTVCWQCYESLRHDQLAALKDRDPLVTAIQIARMEADGR